MKLCKSFLWCLLAASMLLVQVGCGPTCPGQATCVCDDATPCESGLRCVKGLCSKAGEGGEPAGDAAAGDSSGSADEATPRCEAGSKGCRCQIHDECAKGLRCVRNLCQACPAGSAGCACNSGDKCDKGLSCDAGVCRGCEGKANCACYANNRCEPGARCAIDSGGVSRCMACKDRGQEGCDCSKDSECAAGSLCLNGLCAPEEALKQLPASPACYAPCQGNIRERDGKTRTCHASLRLMPGCLMGQRCDAGSCVTTTPKRSGYPFCSSDANCPGWQACLRGRCYANCREDSQCGKGWSCHSYVCRQLCALDKPKCATQQSCQNVGSTENQGVCLPLVSRRDVASAPAVVLFTTVKDTQPPTTSKELFVLSRRALTTTNLANTADFGIANPSAFETQIQISRLSDTTGTKAPLAWLRFDVCKSYDARQTKCEAFTGKPSSIEPFVVTIPAGKSVFLRLSGSAQATTSKDAYEGLLLLKSPQMEQQLKISYRKASGGRWTGRMYSFANFDDTGIDQFPATSSLQIRTLKNALLRRWVNYKRNEISFDQFQAVLQSIQERTWQQTRVTNACKTLFSAQASDDVACYPDASAKGFGVLSNSQREAPVPSGISSLDFAMDVKPMADNRWSGRIVTALTLHYPGDPQIEIGFDEAPGAKAISPLASLKAATDVGGRYVVKNTQGCTNTSDFQKVALPWLLSDFTLDSYAASGSLFRERFACRSMVAPQQVPAGASATRKAAIQAANLSLSGANPIPNGRTLRRTIELVDGALVNNSIFFAIVRERFTSPFAGSSNAALAKDWVRYGYLLLRPTATDFKDDDAKGSTPKSCSGASACGSGETCEQGICQPPSQLQQVACDPAIVKAARSRSLLKTSDLRVWNSQDLDDLVAALSSGQSSAVASQTSLHIVRAVIGNLVQYTYVRSGQNRYVHYYCEDTKQFDGGPIDNPTDCPADSKVVFFEHTTTEQTLRDHSCQKSSCEGIFASLRTSPDYRDQVPYQCVEANAVYCTKNTKDLREGKIFFQPAPSGGFVSQLSPLQEAMSRAFRYRIKFQSRGGKSLGFTPVICDPTAPSQTPYCYDPKVIEQLELRINCLEAIFSDSAIRKRLSTNAKASLKSTLSHAFSFRNRNVNGVIFTDPGFETLNAELRVMLGDEAFTRALTSRYDLAGSNLVSFAGDQLEPNGIKLSGVLGYEMYSLYQSVHYYQSVLDRFYAQTEIFAVSFQSAETSFLAADSVTSYVRKLLLAATRKARSWRHIAARYHALNRGDLAKHVLERAYLGTYMEQVVITQLLHKLLAILDQRQIPQMRTEIERSMLVYNAALIDMQARYQQVLKRLDLFGYPEGYIPFPALSRSAVAANPIDALRTVLATAKEKLRIAAEKEQVALQDKRSFDTDKARFQSEIVKLEQHYNERLIQICGELKDSGRSVPAIPRNAHLYGKGAVADPCGLTPDSYLYQAILQLEQIALQTSQIKQQRDHLYQRMDNEAARIKKFCDDRFALGQITWNFQDERKNLSAKRDSTDLIIQTVSRVAMAMAEIAMDMRCRQLVGGAIDLDAACFGAKSTAAARTAVLAAQEAQVTLLNIQINDSKKELLAQQRDFARTNVQSVCNVCPPDEPKCTTQGVARIQSQHQLAQLALELTTFELHLLTAAHNMRLGLSRVQGLKDQAQRLIQEQDDAIALQLEVNAAANDPNKRIYKNDAVLAAERTFQEALSEVYRLTLLYEYYTSQTYERKGELYLIRMVAKGDVNLEAYLSRLEQAYRDFEEINGKPQLRVLLLSLRDHILKIPQVDKDGTPLGLQARIKLFQEQLNNPKNVDDAGYLSFSFPISVALGSSQLSPVTYGHKAVYVEAEIKATARGDEVGRVYLRQEGTGMVREANDQIKYYTLPARTGVLNTFFNGHKTFEPSIYQSFRFQDRPLGNTRWTLMFNQVSENANKDIDRSAINDIILYVYYRDFSKP